MKLRPLEIRDAEPMLEWMHDDFVVEKLQANFAAKTLEDCIAFIKNSKDANNIHLAIVDDNDYYMGTVSLKHITDTTAEFAITVGRAAMGKGYSKWAMAQIINIAFDEYKVKNVYWCVAPDNLRALSFYDKNNYPKVEASEVQIAGGYTQEQIDSYIWYQVSNNKAE
ncbi:Acetyltransferase (GNAT) domain-containing protein [Pseudobutyrivibrio sp. UC1225]|uniref:GNAT family N-acetyltransferase n=1 Tax=Pseudobutyrivibrio sp. UC1225 TaxID=1798185 RepID=UPI0008ED3435|nr:GNAT family N-acetyltransferase [Pseudobutyrivibrio sp. UC1225]SFO21712.1 Acetyltransferase (GNAT) domain-containing protein [Pseudobutyrivibrio sp. UC1225]